MIIKNVPQADSFVGLPQADTEETKSSAATPRFKGLKTLTVGESQGLVRLNRLSGDILTQLDTKVNPELLTQFTPSSKVIEQMEQRADKATRSMTELMLDLVLDDTDEKLTTEGHPARITRKSWMTSTPERNIFHAEGNMTMTFIKTAAEGEDT